MSISLRNTIVFGLLFSLLFPISVCAQVVWKKDIESLIDDLYEQRVSLDTIDVVWTQKNLDDLVRYKARSDHLKIAASLMDSAIHALRTERTRLGRLQGALRIRMRQYFASWRILDLPLQIQVLNALGYPDSEVSRIVNDERRCFELLQSPGEKGELLELIVRTEAGTIVDLEETWTIKSQLGDDLYKKLLERNYALATQTTELAQTEADYAFVQLSLNGAEVLIRPADADIGVSLDLGRECIGYPFYYGATWNLLAVYRPDRSHASGLSDTYELGFQIPFQLGDQQTTLIGPLSFKQRRINGAPGIVGRFRKQLVPKNSVGGEFSIASLSEKGSNTLVDEQGNPIVDDTTRHFFYIAGNLVIYYARDLSTEILEGLSARVGFGFFQMREARVGGDYSTINSVANHNQSGIYLRVSYEHKDGAQYGINVQYFKSSLLTSAYLNVFDWLGVEAMYSRVVFRDLQTWEDRDLFGLSPRLGFTFSF